MIGSPVSSVRSPPLLVAHLARQGVSATAEARNLEADELSAFMEALRNDPSIDGLMVTMPHKKAILPMLDGVSDLARASGSVNAVKRMKGGRLVGAQFDGTGLVRAVEKAGAVLTEATVLLAGVGGAGLSIAQAIGRRRCRKLHIIDRDTELCDRVVGELAAGGIPAEGRRSIPDTAYDVLVNATPLGMSDGDDSPFPHMLVVRSHFVADIVADPTQTRLAGMVADSGATLITGRDMVHAQIGLIGDWLLHDGIQQP